MRRKSTPGTAPWVRVALAVTAGACSAYAVTTALRRRAESLEEEAARDYEASRRRAEATATPPARDGAQGEGGGGAGATSPGPTTSVATSLDAAAETEAATASTPNFFASTKCVGPQARNSCVHACWRLFTVASVSCTRGGAA